jgi:hypothetical protein
MMMAAMRLTLNLLDAMTAQEVGGRGDGLLQDTSLSTDGGGGPDYGSADATATFPPASRQGI